MGGDRGGLTPIDEPDLDHHERDTIQLTIKRKGNRVNITNLARSRGIKWRPTEGENT